MKTSNVVALCAALAFCASASAQTTSADTSVPLKAAERVVPTGGDAVLSSNTEVWLAAQREVNSKALKVGQSFPMMVSRDVMIGNFVVIPRGTPAEGKISYRTGKGAFGKSAKMEFDLVDVDLNGRVIPVTGHYRIEGRGNTGAAVGAVVAVGVFGAFVTGHSAVVPEGAEYRAYTKGPLPVILTAANAGGAGPNALAK